jgi:aflatoxin B1 aldehyde reductase
MMSDTGRINFSLQHRLGQIYASAYVKPNIETATDQALDLATKHGISGHAAALRWTVYHSRLAADFGDSIIIAASSPDQLISNLDMIEQGPLPEDVVEAVDNLYGNIAGTEMPYHF